MKVLVEFARGKLLTYDSAGLAIKVGQEVIVEGPRWSPWPPMCGVAIALESEYDGPLKPILGVRPHQTLGIPLRVTFPPTRVSTRGQRALRELREMSTRPCGCPAFDCDCPW